MQRTPQGIKHTVGWPEPVHQGPDRASIVKASWKAITKLGSHCDWVARPPAELKWADKASFVAWFASKGSDFVVHTFPTKVVVELLFDLSVPTQDGSRATTCFDQPIGDSDSDRDLSHFSHPVFALRPSGWIDEAQPWEQVLSQTQMPG